MQWILPRYGEARNNRGKTGSGNGKEAGYRSPVLCQNSAQPASTKELRLCLLFIHPGAPNLINLRSVGTIPA